MFTWFKSGSRRARPITNTCINKPPHNHICSFLLDRVLSERAGQEQHPSVLCQKYWGGGEKGGGSDHIRSISNLGSDSNYSCFWINNIYFLWPPWQACSKASVTLCPWRCNDILLLFNRSSLQNPGTGSRWVCVNVCLCVCVWVNCCNILIGGKDKAPSAFQSILYNLETCASALHGKNEIK